MTQSQIKLEIRHATVDFGASRRVVTAVSDVSFFVADGEFCILLGPSGCGKSTLLKAIASFQPLSSGEILLDGRPIGRPEPDRMVIFQEFDQLLAWKTVIENVVFAVRKARRRNRANAETMAQRYLELTGLTKFTESYPHTLSGGMKQRVAIARALAVDPKLLLMDEPFGSLDAMTRQRMQIELYRIWEATHKTIVFVTHSVDEAILLGQRIVILTPHPGTVQTIIDNPYSGPSRGDRPEIPQLRRSINDLLGVTEDNQPQEFVS